VPASLVHEAITRLQKLAELFDARRATLAEQAGLTEQQWEVLERIATEHFMPSMFARHRATSAAAVSRLIRQLIDKRLVTASARATDARQRHYVLTAKGKRTLGAVRHRRQVAIDAIWSPLDAATLTAFVRASDTLIARIEAYETARPQ
jgi:DNA-binding MarR family transcriptional regulator